ncbi:MAG: hypothetical protein ABR954_06320 [Dehalococcoidales bacterium]
MYIRSDNQRLKTKIIATIGSENRLRFSPSGRKYHRIKYGKMFKWFEQPVYGGFMVDILRLNMAFYEPITGEQQYRNIFDWLEDNKDELAKNVGVLCDLAGAKTRLGNIKSKRKKKEGKKMKKIKTASMLKENFYCI